MKRHTLFTLVTLTGALVSPRWTAALEVSVDSRQGQNGETASLQVRVDNATEVGGLTFALEYDGPQLELLEAAPGAALEDAIFAVNPEHFPSPSGQLRFSGVVPQGYTGSAELLQLTFSLPDAVFGDFPVTFRQVSATDIHLQELEVTAVDGGFRIEAPAVDFDGNGKVDFSDFFLFADAFGGSDPRFDLDGDGTVSFTDFFILADSFGKEERTKLIALARQYLGLPERMELKLNYPNPFNASTTLRYQLAEIDAAELVIFDLMGQKVRTLVRETKAPGVHEVVWDGTDERGLRVSTGVYFARLWSGRQSDVRKMILVK